MTSNAAYESGDLCHNGHPFEPGQHVDALDEAGDPRWCDVCGEARKGQSTCQHSGLSVAACKADDICDCFAPDLHVHTWTRGRMTNGDPWWFCMCGEARERDPLACRQCGGPLSEARIALSLTLCSGPCHVAARQAGKPDSDVEHGRAT